MVLRLQGSDVAVTCLLGMLPDHEIATINIILVIGSVALVVQLGSMLAVILADQARSL